MAKLATKIAEEWLKSKEEEDFKSGFIKKGK